jgi:uncharacterized protein YjiS (DUF1127 family)
MFAFAKPFRAARFAWPRRRLGAHRPGLIDRLHAWDAAYRAREQMLRLDDHTLRDIGVTRADIDAALRRR